MLNYYNYEKIQTDKKYRCYLGARRSGVTYRTIERNIRAELNSINVKVKRYEEFIKTEKFKKYKLINRIIFKKELRLYKKLMKILAKKINNIEVV